MSDPNTIRILEIDGGGERGILPMTFLQKFVQQWGVTPTSLAQQFDVICGTSIGGIMALGLAIGLSPTQLLPFFTVQGPYIFSLTSLVPSVRPNLAAKIALLLLDIPFYQSSGPTANKYGSGLLRATISSVFGTNTMANLQTNVVIPSFQYDTGIYVVNSNLNYPQFIGQNDLIMNVALATSAAPVYLPSADYNNHVYIDGGVYQNNPASFGYTLGQMVKPNANRACVLSLGTGLGEYGFDPGNPSMTDSRIDPLVMTQIKNLQRTMPGAFDSIQTIFQLFGISSTGGQESVALSLLLESSYTLQQLYYYRFQPQLDPNLNTELDNTDPAILAYYNQVVDAWYNGDIQNITTFIGHLTA